MKRTFNLITVLVILVVAGALLWRTWESARGNGEQDDAPPTQSQQTPIQPCVPAFADGGGPYYLPNQPFREKIVPEEHNGRTLLVSGQLWQSDCVTPIVDAVIDIWQADETGEYQDEWYRGQIRSGENGQYKFETVMPLGYGEGTAYRPPHLHFKVHIDGRLVATSQMFFEDVRGRTGFNDAYIIPVNTEERDGEEVLVGEYQIVLDL